MPKRGPNPMPEDVWQKIKEYQKHGCKAAFTARMIGWSNKAVGRAYRSDSYAEYLASASPKKKPEKLIDPSDFMSPEDAKKWSDATDTVEKLVDYISHNRDALENAISFIKGINKVLEDFLNTGGTSNE